MVKLINGFCYLICVACVFFGVVLILNHLWTPLRNPNEWKYIVSLVVIFVGALITLRISRKFRK